MYHALLCRISIKKEEKKEKKEVLPEKFTLYRKDRASRGGDVLIAVNNLLPSYLIPSPPNLEVVTIKLCFAGNHNISICTVYIPPNPNVSYFNLIVGDFNLPDICWPTLSGSTLLSNLFCDFMFESNLSQLITCPTLVKATYLIYFSLL